MPETLRRLVKWEKQRKFFNSVIGPYLDSLDRSDWDFAVVYLYARLKQYCPKSEVSRLRKEVEKHVKSKVEAKGENYQEGPGEVKERSSSPD